MKTYIALLRGINVGGHHKILMKDLITLLESIGFIEVRTYIQSGNVVFKTSESDRIAQDIEDAILHKYGFEISVLVKTPSEINAIVKECPFSEEKKAKSYFTMMFEVPSEETIHEINHLNLPGEEIIITKKCIYFFCATGYGRAKFTSSFIERKLKNKATARNFRTMAKLIELATL